MKYLGIGVLVLAAIAGLCLLLGGEKGVGTEPAVVIEQVASSTEEVADNNAEIIALIEADIASTEERTLEIGGWKKLSDDPYLNLSEQDRLEIWIPEELFTNGSYDSGKGSAIPLYRWPSNLEKTGENFDLLRPYLLDLVVGRVDIKNNFSGTSSINPNSVLDSYPVEINDSHSIKFDKPQKVGSEVIVEISITIQKKYTNSSDIFDEILERLVITYNE